MGLTKNVEIEFEVTPDGELITYRTSEVPGEVHEDIEPSERWLSSREWSAPSSSAGPSGRYPSGMPTSTGTRVSGTSTIEIAGYQRRKERCSRSRLFAASADDIFGTATWTLKRFASAE
ncbi:MAG TPA: hypothetical protein ENJ16_03040 [Planctomycetaceae bacterium]|nr:hypothetical protein [Planctomycetaceae bacterium]